MHALSRSALLLAFKKSKACCATSRLLPPVSPSKSLGASKQYSWLLDPYMRLTRAAAGLEGRMEAVVERLKVLAIGQFEPVSDKKAAVLVPLFEDAGVHALDTEGGTQWTQGGVLWECSGCRRQGEVALPGGKRDETDVDDVHTALREAEEEIGLTSSCVSILGCLRPFLSLHKLSVTPVIGVVPRECRGGLRPAEDEVDAVFDVPLDVFLRESPSHSYKDVMWRNAGLPYRIHFFESHGFNIWGLTAAIMIQVSQIALGRPPEFDEWGPAKRPYTDAYFNGTEVVLRS